jgi:hypothetical protein
LRARSCAGREACDQTSLMRCPGKTGLGEGGVPRLRWERGRTAFALRHVREQCRSSRASLSRSF